MNLKIALPPRQRYNKIFDAGKDGMNAKKTLPGKTAKTPSVTR